MRGMDEPRHVNAIAVVCLPFVVLLPVSYLAGYFFLSKHSPGATPEHRCRMFRSRWLVSIYKPAAKVESTVTGDKVSTYFMP